MNPAQPQPSLSLVVCCGLRSDSRDVDGGGGVLSCEAGSLQVNKTLQHTLHIVPGETDTEGREDFQPYHRVIKPDSITICYGNKVKDKFFSLALNLCTNNYNIKSR